MKLKIVEVEFVEEGEEIWVDADHPLQHLSTEELKAYRRRPLCHSFEIGWDAHDQPRQDTSQPTDWRGVAKAVVLIVFIIGVTVWVAW